jgi:predicted RNA-binding Zn-ribbon protein involved in translation (DUF1610 family)
MAPGTCPACLSSINRNELEISKAFRCPNCGQLLRTTPLFRTCMRLFSFGLATCFVVLSDWSTGVKIVAWPILWFILNTVYLLIVHSIRPPRLVLCQKKDDPPEKFQKVGLS